MSYVQPLCMPLCTAAQLPWLIMARWDGHKSWRGAVRWVSRWWRTLHDDACMYLTMYNGVTDEVMHVLSWRTRALTRLHLDGSRA